MQLLVQMATETIKTTNSSTLTDGFVKMTTPKCKQIMNAVDTVTGNPTDVFEVTAATAATAATDYVKKVDKVVDELVKQEEQTCTCTTMRQLVPMIVSSYGGVLRQEVVLQNICTKVEKIDTLDITKKDFKTKLNDFLTAASTALKPDESRNAVVLQSILYFVSDAKDRSAKHWSMKAASKWGLAMANILFDLGIPTPVPPPPPPPSTS